MDEDDECVGGGGCKVGAWEMTNERGDKGKSCPLACFYSFYFHLANYLVSQLLTNTGRMRMRMAIALVEVMDVEASPTLSARPPSNVIWRICA